MSIRLTLLLCGLVCLLSLAGCGGGGGAVGDLVGGEPGDGGPVEAPPAYATGPLRATIQFPPHGSLGKCGQITVRGTAGGKGIAGVLVNGVPATGFGEFGDWVARVPLLCGSNVIRVDVLNEAGGRLASADTVRLDALEEFVYVPGAIGAGTEPGAIYVVDEAIGDVVVVNFDQGTRHALGFAPTRSVTGNLMVDDGGRNLYLQNGYDLIRYSNGFFFETELEGKGGSSIQAIASDVDNDRFFALAGQKVYEYDALTGDRTLISSPFGADTRGSGPALSAPDGLAYSPDFDAVFCANGLAIGRVNLTTGNRLAFPTPAAEPGDEVRALLADGDVPRLLVYATRETGPYTSIGLIYSYNLITGIRTLLSGPGAGTGVELPAIGRAREVTLEWRADRLFVSDELRGHVVAVELATGNRTVVVHHQVGSGPALLVPSDALIDPSTGRLIVGNALDDSLLSVDLSTGNRSLLSGKTRGSGPDTVNFEGLVEDFAGGAIFALDPYLPAVVRIDLANGNRSIVSDDTIGSGTPFDRPVDIAWGPDPGVLYVADRDLGHPALPGAIVAVDIATGNRTTLSDGLLTLSIPWREITGMAYDPIGRRFLTSDRKEQIVSAVDDTSGLRSQVSENRNVGIGLALEAPYGLNLDGGRALVPDWILRGMFSVDLATGNRLVIYDREHGRGPITLRPRAAIPHVLPGQLIVLDALTSMILVVDEASGDRVLFSR